MFLIFKKASLFLLIFLIFNSCENDINEVNKFISKEQSGLEVGTNLEILYSDSAKIKVKINADTMYRILDPGNQRDVFPHGIKLTFFDKNGTLSSTLTSNRAERIVSKKKVICSDSVTLNNVKNESVFTNELIWDENLKEVHTEKFVKLTRPGEVIYSFGLKADQSFSKYELKAISGKLDAKRLESGLK